MPPRNNVRPVNNNAALQAELNQAVPFNLSSPNWNIRPGNSHNEILPTGFMKHNLPVLSKSVSKGSPYGPNIPVEDGPRVFKLGLPPTPKPSGLALAGGTRKRHRSRRGRKSRGRRL